MIQLLVFFDKEISEIIRVNLSNLFLIKKTFLIITLLGNYSLIWVVFFLLIFFEHKSKLRLLKYFLIILSISFIFNDILLKNVFHRNRPLSKKNITNIKIDNSQNLYSFKINYPLDSSFPSGHSNNSFAMATYLAFINKKRKYIYFSFAFLIALSRVVLGYHYLFDIIFGALLGFLISSYIIKNFYKHEKT